MKKLVGKFLTLGLSIAMLFGLISLSPAQGPSAVDVAAAENGYYSSITADSGTQLLGQLHDLITTTHKKYPTYKGLNSIYPQSDPGLDGKGVLEFYTHETLTGNFGSSVGNPNKEHVWPKSLSNGLWKDVDSGDIGAGADLHHIRPTEMTLNSKRGNDKYGNVDKNSAEKAYSKKVGGAQSELGGYSSGGVFMPLDNVKGDVARIVMYVYTHYNTYSNVNGTTNGSGSAKFGTLHFNDVIKANSEADAIKILLDWNDSDPVDTIEQKRNEVGYQEQGNRNPFIDNESYAEAIWGDGTATPSPDVGGGSGSGTGSQTTASFKPLTEPQEGTYKFAMDVNGTYHYATGEMVNTYYFAASTNASEGADFTLTQQGNGWVIKQGSKFVEIALVTSGGKQHINAVYNNSQTANKVWTWDAEHNIFVWDEGGEKYCIGNYGTGNHETSLSADKLSTYLNQSNYYLSYLGTYGTDEPVTPPTDDSEAKIQAALATLSSKTITTTGTTTLVASSGDVSFKWSTDTQLPDGISFKGNTLTVSKLPANDTAIVFTVTASLNGKTGSKTVTVTVKGTGGGTVTPPTPGETKTIKITTDSFKSLSSTYDFFDWTADGISGYAFIYGDVKSTGKTMQFNKSKDSYYLANTTELPGVLKSVKITATTSQSWKLLTSSTAYGQVKGAPSGTGTIESPENGVITWTVTDPNAKYFALVVDGSGASKLSSIEITYGSGSQTVDPDPDVPDPDTHMQALADALKPFEDHAKWNFAVTELDTGDEGTYHDYYEYLGYNLLNRYTVNGNDDNDENDKTYTDYLAYDAATGKSTFYADMGDGTYEAYAAGTDEYEDAISYIYSIDPSALKDYSFTYANGKYSAQNPAAVGNAVIGEYGYYDDDDTWIPSVWTSFDIYLGSDGKVSKIVAVQDGQTMEYTFSKYGSVNFTLPEVGGTDPVDPPAVTGITVSPATLSLTVGDTKNTTYFTVKAQPADAELGTVTFTTTDTSIIKIENGVITALAAGSATIKVSASGFEATISVTVTAASTPVDPDKNDGTAAKPYTVEEALALGANLGNDEYYKVDGVEKEIYVKGYVTDIGMIFKEHGLSSVKIADEKGGTTTLLLYSINWGEAMAKPDPIPSDSPLQVGDYIVIHGFLMFYGKTSTLEIEKNSAKDTYPMLSTWQRDGKDVGTTTPVDPEPDTHEQDLAAVQAALAEVTDKTIEEAGTTEFPATSGDVALAWALATTEELPEGITFANGKLTVTALPETETTIRLTVTAALKDAEESKTITITVKAADKADPDPDKPDPDDPVDPVDPDPDDPDEPVNPDPDDPDPDEPDPDEPDKPDPDEPDKPDPDNPGSDTPSTPGSDTPSTPGSDTPGSSDTPSTPENPDEGEAPSQPAEEKKGCGGEIGGAVLAVVAIIMAAALVIVVVEKKRQ